jgi:transposase-like protein
MAQQAATGGRAAGRSAAARDRARPEPPGPDAGTEPGLGVAAVARRLGVAAATLRTWDRRYGVGPTAHQAGAHRRYTAGDLARLALMRRLMLEGVTAAEAARVALTAELPALGTVAPMAPAGPAPRREAGPARGAPPRRARAGGGRVIAVRHASPAARGLARAAMALDGPTCVATVTASLRAHGVVATWDELVLPVLAGVGERWRATGLGVEVEHLLCECVEDCLRVVTRRAKEPRNPRPVLLAALEGEEQRLPLHAVAAGLAERSIGVRMLGPRLPVAALARAVQRTGAAGVFLWAQGPDPARASALEALPAVRPTSALVLGGPGWAGAPLPGNGRWVPDLGAAVAAVATAVGLTADPR